MRRQENSYIQVSPEHCKLFISAKNNLEVLFDADMKHSISMYKWSHRGKGLIVNEFGVSLGWFLAESFGYEQGEWVRKKANLDYTISNFAYRCDAPVISPQTTNIAATPYNAMGVANMPRLKYKTKHECVDVTVPLLNNKTVTLKINKFAAQYIPSMLKLDGGEPKCLDGRALKHHLLSMLNVEYDHIKYRSYTKLLDPFDLRLDPNDLTYVNRYVDRTRFHFFDDPESEETELCVIEVQDNTRSGARFFWQPANMEQKWRMPMWHTQFLPRVAYCVVNADIAERLDDVYWDDKNSEWYVRDIERGKIDEETGLIKPEHLKRVVARSAGHQLENIYFPPRQTKKYSQALEAEFDVSSKEGRIAARRRARYENKIDSAEARGGMFTKPRYIKRKKVVADSTYFCTAIYGGVGIWCADMRRESVYIPGFQTKDGDHTKRKE